MTLTPSDVASLTSALTYWEYAEYVSGALVAIACAGEYIASFKPWFTGGDEERKKRLEKRSTLLLIAALAAELICLVRTNHISGQVIGALDTKAAEAFRKSSIAVANADSALGKARAASAEIGTVRTDVGKVKTEAGKAATLASSATRESTSAGAASSKALQVATNSESVARAARQEADSFEKDIVSAKKQAADAEAHLAEALERANRAAAEAARLTTRFADRSLSDAQVQYIGGELRSFSGQEYRIVTIWETPECVLISNRIHLALVQVAGWKYSPLTNGEVLLGGIVGVLVYVHPSPPNERTRAAADRLVSVLNANGIAAQVKLENPTITQPITKYL